MGYDIDWARNRTEDLFDKAIKTKRTFNASKMGLDLVGRGIDPPDFMKKAINTRMGVPNSDYTQKRTLDRKSFVRGSEGGNFDKLLSSAKDTYAAGGDGFLIESTDMKSPGQVSGFTVGTYSTPEKAKTPDWISNLAKTNAAAQSAEIARKTMAEFQPKFVDEYEDGAVIGKKQMVYDLPSGQYKQAESLLDSLLKESGSTPEEGSESTPEEGAAMLSGIKEWANQVRGIAPSAEALQDDAPEEPAEKDFTQYSDVTVTSGKPGMLGFGPYVMGKNPKGVSTRMFPVERPETKYGDATYKNKKYADFVEKMKRLGLDPDGKKL